MLTRQTMQSMRGSCRGRLACKKTGTHLSRSHIHICIVAYLNRIYRIVRPMPMMIRHMWRLDPQHMCHFYRRDVDVYKQCPARPGQTRIRPLRSVRTLSEFDPSRSLSFPGLRGVLSHCLLSGHHPIFYCIHSRFRSSCLFGFVLRKKQNVFGV